MITRLREVRRARRMTLHEVAARCEPPTTPQTIGRLETGARTLSVGWLNRIAKALGVEAADLVALPERETIPLAATLDQEGAHAPRREGIAVPPSAAPGLVAMQVRSSIGDYRSGDELWLQRLAPEAYAGALNRDLLLPRPGGRFLFGRLIGREGDRLHLLPFGAGQRQTVVTDPPWAAVAVRLIRNL
jgi:hypothetical protein